MSRGLPWFPLFWIAAASLGAVLVGGGALLFLSNRSESIDRLASKNRVDGDDATAYKLGSLKELSELSSSMAERAFPSLVRITVKRSAAVGKDKEFESFFGQLASAKGIDVGSGFFFQSGGWILTNYHVVRGADTIQVEGAGGKNWLAKMHAYDSLSDLSVLKVDDPIPAVMEWGDSRRLKIGHFVWVAGAPFGLERSLSFGIVSSLERDSLNGSPLRDYFQTDAAINPGSSGGPMLDVDGKVVGVVSSILGEEHRGIGFALRGDVAQSVATQLVAQRTIKRGWIGVQLGAVSVEQAKKANLESPTGATIEWIDAGEESRVPARKAGLMPGDICVRCNGLAILSQFDLARKIGMTTPGTSLTLELIRDSQKLIVSLVAVEKP